ncbi:HU family DNA-binding protein [Serinicoccus kebangsaanensis]|uniref:HU family DNA-binding protein n=1 Tax=Serinicoccus kebangsaanensis TaxID=2602069 RepID=UPI00124CE634|nr:HU family DNA-binding protein [Serinicoccus kebangsaanensis]
MNKTDLIEALAPRVGGRAAAGAAVEALVDVVLREVAAGGSVGISGFGTFERVDRAPRTGRNPRTGEAVPIDGTSTPRFRPGSYFKDVVADPTTLPSQGMAGVRGGASPAAREQESAGTPSTVRRDGAAPPRDAASARRQAARDASRERRQEVTTGTPATVRKPKVERPEPVAEREGQQPSSGGPPFSGGEEITAGMITAKKAQLARVKNDETTKGAKKSKKKSGKKKSGKKRKGQPSA